MREGLTSRPGPFNPEKIPCRHSINRWVGPINFHGRTVVGIANTVRRYTDCAAPLYRLRCSAIPTALLCYTDCASLNYILISSSYRAVNTLRLSYKNQSVNAV